MFSLVFLYFIYGILIYYALKVESGIPNLGID